MAFAALRSVWASQYNERAYLSLRKAGLPHEQLCMAVLVQRVVPADYAFVIHTENPSTGNPDEIYIELVRGLGETLVGNYAGRALSAVVQKSNLTQPEVLSFPSKSVGLFVEETLIFRSDSNGEDLDGACVLPEALSWALRCRSWYASRGLKRGLHARQTETAVETAENISLGMHTP